MGFWKKKKNYGFKRNEVEELWVSVVTDVGFDVFAEILMVAGSKGGGGGNENLMGILTFYLF